MANYRTIKTWVDYRHPAYDEAQADRKYAWDHYSGACDNFANRGTYLPKKTQSENTDAHKERVAISCYEPWMATSIDSLRGKLFSAVGVGAMSWGQSDGPTWGDPSASGTLAHLAANNADGRGSGLMSIGKALSAHLLVHGRGDDTPACWMRVTSRRAQVQGGAIRNRPALEVIPADAVVNWFDEDGAPQVMMKISQDARGSIRDEPKSVDRYLLYQLDGWKMLDDAGVEVESGLYERPLVDAQGVPALAIFPVYLKLDRPVGLQLARISNSIWNMAAQRDFVLRAASFPKLLVPVATTEELNAFIALLAEGANLLSSSLTGHQPSYIGPPQDCAVTQDTIIKSKQEAFSRLAFQLFGNAAQSSQATATSIMTQMDSGMGAILQLLKGSVEDALNKGLFLGAQVEWPEGPTATPEWWGAARIQLPDTFGPQDADTEAQKELNVVATAPIGRTAKVQAVMRAAEWRGLKADEEEVAREIDLLEINKAAASLVALQVPLPSSLKAALVASVARIAGLVTNDAEMNALAGEVETMAEDEQVAVETGLLAAQLVPQNATVVAPVPAGEPKPKGRKPAVKKPVAKKPRAKVKAKQNTPAR